MATATLPPPERHSVPVTEPEAPTVEPAEPTNEAEIYTWEFWGHRGDQIGFAIWIACFLLMGTMILWDLLSSLLGR
jgi:hypothetical protein